MSDAAIRAALEATPAGCIPAGQEEGYGMGIRDGVDAVREAVDAWVSDRRKALSKQGIVSGHSHHDLALLEAAVEAAAKGEG